MKKYYLLLLIVFLFSFDSIKIFADNNLNLIPMYGEDKITKEQKESNDKFIEEVIKAAGTREKALEYALDRAWEYFYKGDLATSMMRFNQAWLLNPDNYESYWGFGILMGHQNKMDESIRFLDKALAMDPENNKVMVDLGYSYTKYIYFYEMKADEELEYLMLSIGLYEKAESIDKMYAPLYNNWAVTLTTLGEYQKALDKLNHAKSLGFKPDPKFIRDIKKKLKQSKKNNKKNKIK